MSILNIIRIEENFRDNYLNILHELRYFKPRSFFAKKKFKKLEGKLQKLEQVVNNDYKVKGKERFNEEIRILKNDGSFINVDESGDLSQMQIPELPKNYTSPEINIDLLIKRYNYSPFNFKIPEIYHIARLKTLSLFKKRKVQMNYLKQGNKKMCSAFDQEIEKKKQWVFYDR